MGRTPLHLRTLFTTLAAANLMLNLKKSEFGHVHVTYLGYVVGQGQVRPVMSKVDAIQNFCVPVNKKELMRFLGMAGYYSRNFSVVTAPLTNLLKKREPYVWSSVCQQAFERVKAILYSNPILVAPDFGKQFKLAVDASDVGAGSVLQQEDDQGIDYQVCYYSTKFDEHQSKYSTIEKETLALLLSLKHFNVYLSCTVAPVKVYTDHNPLVFINRMKNSYQRLILWHLALQKYNLEIHHIKDRDNVIADALSRAM